MRRIAPEETEIRGAWVEAGGSVKADEACRRIDDLVRSHLEEVGRAAAGWDLLLVDPDDGRYWERIYPESGAHGGGPPMLRHISPEEAAGKYGEPGAARRDAGERPGLNDGRSQGGDHE